VPSRFAILPPAMTPVLLPHKTTLPVGLEWES
jgi:hypothetical protein